MAEAHTIGKLLRSLTREDAGQAGAAFAQTDFDDLMKSAEFIGNLFPAWVFVLCRYNHPHTPYFSPNAQQVLGYPAGHLSRMSPEEYFAYIHPEDAKALQSSYEYMRNWFRQSPEPDPANFRFTLHYRFKSPEHGYQYLLDEQHCFQNRSGKRVYFALFKVQSEPFSQMKLEVYQRSHGDFRKLTEYVPRAVKGPVITPREKDVLLGIREGLTSKQIAEKFSVSVFTVRNHRSNIFEKARAQNMVQLIRYAEAAGWI
jgi:DNA-binding CsgD family transcriptional regulator